MMNIDEVIKGEENIANACREQANMSDLKDPYAKKVAYENGECAEMHKQIAKWLKQLQKIRGIIEAYRNMPVEVMDVLDAFNMICNVVDESEG